MTLALWLAAAGIAIYFYINPAFRVLALSNHYAAAPTEAQRAGLLAAMPGLLMVNSSSARVRLGLLLVTLAGLMICARHAATARSSAG